MLSWLTFNLLLGGAGNYNQGKYAVEKGQKESAFHGEYRRALSSSHENKK